MRMVWIRTLNGVLYNIYLYILENLKGHSTHVFLELIGI